MLNFWGVVGPILEYSHDTGIPAVFPHPVPLLDLALDLGALHLDFWKRMWLAVDVRRWRLGILKLGSKWLITNIWVFPKNRGTPKWMVYNGKSLLKWMIWGYPYLWKHPYRTWICIKYLEEVNIFYSPKLVGLMVMNPMVQFF